MYRFILFIGLAFTTTSVQAEETGLRDWTNHQGKSMQATFVEINGNNVILERPGGKKLRVALNQLVRDDQVYARSMASGAKASTDEERSGEAPGAFQDLFGETLYNADKDKIPVSALADKKKIGIYFSAHWCPPCRSFTPSLVDAYNEMKEDGEPFEVVFVSSDRSKDAMFDYMEWGKMPWLAVKHQSDTAEELKQRFEVSGIPKLVIIDDDGELLTSNGRGDIDRFGEEAYDKW
jgi:nucleoredoxin